MCNFILNNNIQDVLHFHESFISIDRRIMDNLNIHCEGALYKTFPPEEARRVLRRLELHFTPVHASWLNMVEIEIGILSRQCLDRRISQPDELAAEVAAWERARNDAGATIRWLFDVSAARDKLKRHYPQVAEHAEAPIVRAA